MKEKRKCSVENCGNKHRANGFCDKHNQHYKKYGTIEKNIKPKRLCSIENCAFIHNANGYCSRHNYNLKTYNSIIRPLNTKSKPRKKRIKKICSIEFCNKNIFALNYCRSHYSNFKRNGNPIPRIILKNTKICLANNCLNPFHALGYCLMHYHKFINNRDMDSKIEKHTVNDNFFSEENELSFYWAGFLAADGCLFKSKGESYGIHLTLAIKDKEHVELFKNNIGSTGHNLLYSCKISGNDNMHDAVGISFYSKKIFNDLLNIFNLTPNKSLTYCPPNDLKKHNFIRHFIRGYFDGDGTITGSRDKKYNVLKAFWAIIGTQNCMNYFNNIFAENLNISTNIKKYVNIYRFGFAAKKDLKIIYNYLYKNATVFLKRKKDKFEYYLNILDNQIFNPITMAKLTESEVLKIREMKNSISSKKIALQFNVNVKTINNIISKRTWSHI